jgi:hypothetical protein
VNAQRSSDGWSALHVAAMAGRLEVATLLLQAGADPGLEDHQEVTAGQLARRYGHRAVADCILSPRDKYRPEFPVLYMDFLKMSAQVSTSSPSPSYLHSPCSQTASRSCMMSTWSGGILVAPPCSTSPAGLATSNSSGLSASTPT